VKSLSNKSFEEKRKIVTTKELSEILGLSDRRIRQLENEGSLVKITHGKFDLPQSIQKYIQVIKEQSESDEEIDLTTERTLLTRANRQKVELELKIMQGELHRSEDIEQVMNDMLGTSRARLLGIPGKIASKLIALTEVEVIKNIIKTEIYEALQELSDYDPHVFYAKSRDKLSIEEEVDENGEETIGEVNKEPPKYGKRSKPKKRN
jgi:phage terminase Nu1 subunit (DNA packaging protein)